MLSIQEIEEQLKDERRKKLSDIVDEAFDIVKISKFGSFARREEMLNSPMFAELVKHLINEENKSEKIPQQLNG